MSIEQQELNLARKLRPRQFSHVVGQDVTIKILQNSLYLGKRFPLYIFSGQRGCGKTTTARIFAAALNCEQYANFRRDPKNYVVPCLSCLSCRAMEAGNHYDFIEMDAASHTGVENVRSILDSAQHKPLGGVVKIYLIDEAHMLSKAAFNAFLKILEEPPPFVAFILATTDMHKIPDTVTSRAFNLFFQSMGDEVVTRYLKEICAQENIAIDDDALELLTHEGGGSLRDSINVLETVRLSGKQITRDHALNALGRMSEEKVLDLFEYIVSCDAKGLLDYLVQIRFDDVRPATLWDMIIALIRSLIWVTHGVSLERGLFRRHAARIADLAHRCSRNRLVAMIQLVWDQEQVFIRTSHKHIFLEHLLLELCEQVNVAPLADVLQSLNGSSSPKEKKGGVAVAPHVPTPHKPPQEPVAKPQQVSPPSPGEKQDAPPVADATWQAFQKKVATLDDPLLSSIIQQARYGGIDEQRGAVLIILPGGGAFFTAKLEESQTMLAPVIAHYYPKCSKLMVKAEVGESSDPVQKTTSSSSASPSSQRSVPQPKAPSGPRRIDVSDTEKWPKANLLGEHFSGTIEKVPDDA